MSTESKTLSPMVKFLCFLWGFGSISLPVIVDIGGMLFLLWYLHSELSFDQGCCNMSANRHNLLEELKSSKPSGKVKTMQNVILVYVNVMQKVILINVRSEPLFTICNS